MRLLCPLIAGLAALACAPAAFGATVSVHEQPRKLSFAAAPGETNQVTVAHDGAALVVTDATAPIAAGDGCAGRPDGSVRCALAGGQAFNVAQVGLGDGDDTAVVAGPLAFEVEGDDGNDALTGADGDDELVGGLGDDRLEGRAGADELDGGEGDDVLLARDAVRDTVECGGGGADSAEADVEDEVDAACEVVDKPLVPATTLSATEVAAPVATHSVGVRVKRGTIRVRPPGARDFVALEPSQPVPVGATLDARDGTLTLTAASDASGGTQTADFRAGRFVVRQVPGPVLTTELRLRGGGFRRACRPAATSADSAAGAVARAAADRRKRRAVRKLWGSGHGRFRTRGRNSAATVRGTVWKVVDRCDGTLTKVKRGIVVVEDFARDRTKVVRAGESFLAERPRRARRG